MNKTSSEVNSFVHDLSTKTKEYKNIDFGLAIPYVYLQTAKKHNANKAMILSAQNCHFEDSGAFTGEISPKMLEDIGISWSIIGHSERRQYYKETNRSINKKLHKLINEDMKVILCVGESLKEFEAGDTEIVLDYQIRTGLQLITKTQMKNLVIAYEPVWAIGTGRTASAKQAQETCLFVRELVKEMFDEEVSSALRIQYGGSMNPGNASELLEQPDIDGGLIGGASLKLDFFLDIIKTGSEC